MSLIPAILYLTKPKIKSIDDKGRATMKIKLLFFNLDPYVKNFGYTVTKVYNKFKSDLLIMVKKTPYNKNIFQMSHVIGPVTNQQNWEKILPLRFNIPSLKDHQYLKLQHQFSLRPTESDPPLGETTRKYLLVDKVGTIDREDGIWFDSNEDFGVFTIDFPTQYGWTDNSKSSTQILSEQLINLEKKYYKIPTRSIYLPTYRLSMLNPSQYYSINEDTLKYITYIPIICFHWNKKTIFRSKLYRK